MNYHISVPQEPSTPDIDWRTWTVRKGNEYYA